MLKTVIFNISVDFFCFPPIFFDVIEEQERTVFHLVSPYFIFKSMWVLQIYKQ